MSKIIYLDVETTGLSKASDRIHQLAGMIEVDGQVTVEFDIKMRPSNLHALPDNYKTHGLGLTKAQLAAYPDQREGYDYFTMLLSTQVNRYQPSDRYFICGYNSQSFDSDFIRAWFEENGSNFYGAWFWSVNLDVMILAGDKLRDERPTMKNFQLGTVAEKMGLTASGNGLHDAMTDIRLTRDMYNLLQMW